MKFHMHLIMSVFIFLLVLSGGAYTYHQVEGWGVIDSAYFVVVTVTTIGYGDLAPKTYQGKIFTMFFSFFGIAFTLYFFSMISGSIFKKHLNTKVGQIRKAIEREEEVEKSIDKKLIRKRKK